MWLLVVAIALPTTLTLIGLFWLFGPGAMRRRKEARRRLRGDLGVMRMQEVWEQAVDPTPNLSWFGLRPKPARHKADPPTKGNPAAKRPVQQAVDREALEREIRRWD
jgi:hypothetical protein